MKLQIFTVFFLVASAFALPREGEQVVVAELNDLISRENPVEGSIRRAIERISARIQLAGLDPLEVIDKEFEFVPILIDLVIRGYIENLTFYGLSDISINVLEYSYIFNRLRIDVSFPEVAIWVGNSGLDVLLVGVPIQGQLKNGVSVKSVRLAGEVFVNVDLIGGISLRSLSVNFSLGGIESDLNVVFQESDLSENINDILNRRIPNFFEDNKNDINNFLESVISIILNRVWSL